MGNFFLDLTIIICLAAVLSIVFRVLRQPAILAYILTGFILGSLAVAKINNPEILKSLSEIGITLLLFMVGLELRLSDLKAVGKTALITGVGQIVFTSLIGFIISLALGFSVIASAYISVALTFSSTIIIVKLLSDKKDLKSLYGKISVGFLLVQDFFAILALIFLSGFNANGISINALDFVLVILKGILLFGSVIYLSKAILPSLVEKIPHTSETLFLFSLAFAFAMSFFVSSPPIGFSIEIGGFLAGLALANSVESFQIVARVRPLRDFFVIIFFVSLGMGFMIGNFAQIIIPAIIFSIFILIGNPLIVMIIIGILGYKKRIGFLAGLTVAQISEFSLILVFLGNRLGHLSNEVVSLVTLVGIITFISSSYMILNGNYLYKILSPYLSIFERKNTRPEHNIQSDGFDNLKNHVVIIGGDHMGQSIIEALENKGEELVLIDFDPSLIEKYRDENILFLFGDISDLDIQEKAQIDNAKLVISTIPDIEDNLILLKELRHENRGVKVIIMALDSRDAKLLYKEGVDYVVLPHLAGGRQIAKMITENYLDKIESFKQKDSKYLG